MKDHYVLGQVKAIEANVVITHLWTGRRWVAVEKTGARPKVFRSKGNRSYEKAKESAENAVWWFKLSLAPQ